jgi:hypothetical protein
VEFQILGHLDLQTLHPYFYLWDYLKQVMGVRINNMNHLKHKIQDATKTQDILSQLWWEMEHWMHAYKGIDEAHNELH